MAPRSGIPEPHDFDVDRCIELHNKIVHACIAKNPDVPVTRGYFAYHAQINPESVTDLEEMRKQFDDDGICAFLDGIDMTHQGPGNHLALTPEIMHVCWPYDMWDLGTGDSHIRETWFVCLYQGHDFHQSRGLVFDLETYSATFVQAVQETYGFDVDNPVQQPGLKRLWLSLEEVLQEWWDRIETGKYVPVHCNAGPPHFEPGSETPGWWMAPYRPQDLKNKLLVWDEYVDAIVSRMPPTLNVQVSDTNNAELTTLLDTNAIRPGNFLREFLLRGRKPPPALTFIAPGLKIPTIEFLARNLSKVHEQLLSFNGGLHREEWRYFSAPSVLFPLSNASETDSIIHGLVLSAGFDRFWEDGVAISLPADTASLPSTMQLPCGHRRENSLFQPGLCPFGYDHCARLELVLSKWKDLVEQGVWTVGEQGVQGGSEWLEQRRDPHIVENESLDLEAVCM